MSDRRYPIRYSIQSHSDFGWKKEELGPDGGTDAILVCSILRKADGGLSYQWISLDSRHGPGPVPANEIFSAWAILGSDLAGRQLVSAELREIAREAVEKARKVIAP